MTTPHESPPQGRSRSHAFATLRDAARRLLTNAVKLSLDLYKVMIPVILVIKLLEELDLIRYAAWPLSPVMRLAGLPVEMGLVWAFAIISNLYSGIIVYAALAPNMTVLSTAQVTVLATMMLVAHNIPVECRIVKMAGVSFLGQAAIRILGGAAFGILLHAAFSGLNILQSPSIMLVAPSPQSHSLWIWALGQAKTLAMVFVVITCLLALMRLLNLLRVTDLFIFLLKPVLRLLGIGKSAATVTIIGLTMGLTYGGGLIVHEVRNGRVDKADLFPSLTLMGMSHALIEDTLLMALIGANLLGTFWLRLILSLLAVAIMTRVMARVRAPSRRRLPAQTPANARTAAAQTGADRTDPGPDPELTPGNRE